MSARYFLICLAASTIGQAACAQNLSHLDSTALVVPVRTVAGSPEDPPILEVTFSAPQGSVLEIATDRGVLLGYVTAYDGPQERTGLIALPEDLEHLTVSGVTVRSLDQDEVGAFEVSDVVLRQPQ